MKLQLIVQKLWDHAVHLLGGIIVSIFILIYIRKCLKDRKKESSPKEEASGGGGGKKKKSSKRKKRKKKSPGPRKSFPSKMTPRMRGVIRPSRRTRKRKERPVLATCSRG